MALYQYPVICAGAFSCSLAQACPLAPVQWQQDQAKTHSLFSCVCCECSSCAAAGHPILPPQFRNSRALFALLEHSNATGRIPASVCRLLYFTWCPPPLYPHGLRPHEHIMCRPCGERLWKQRVHTPAPLPLDVPRPSLAANVCTWSFADGRGAETVASQPLGAPLFQDWEFRSDPTTGHKCDERGGGKGRGGCHGGGGNTVSRKRRREAG